MRLVCGPNGFAPPVGKGDVAVDLYRQPQGVGRASAGEAARNRIIRARLECAPRAWDLLSIALSVVTADFAKLRAHSPDGWTRELELDVAVADRAFWARQARALAEALRFLTTDRWTLHFHGGGTYPDTPNPFRPSEDCVVLLSGGLDSLVGAIDLVAAGRRPLAVSQIVRGTPRPRALSPLALAADFIIFN